MVPVCTHIRAFFPSCNENLVKTARSNADMPFARLRLRKEILSSTFFSNYNSIVP